MSEKKPAGIGRWNPRRMGEAWRRAEEWVCGGGVRTAWGSRARLGAAWGAILTVFLTTGFLAWNMKSGMGWLFDVGVGLGVALAAILVLGGVVGLLGCVARVLLRFLGLMGMGAVAAFAVVSSEFPWGWMLGLGVVGMEALLAGALFVLFSEEIRAGVWWKRAVTTAAVAVGCAGNAALIGWLLFPGGEIPPEASREREEDAPDVREVRLAGSDPGEPGQWRVLTLTYGSGKDRHRTEFGKGVGIRTESVDASPFLDRVPGLAGKFRDWYWGYGMGEAPRNGRVWYPEGKGPFPLVMIVHGNHNMADFSDAGFAYLGKLLASRGFVAVSVDENFLNRSWAGPLQEENDARAWLLLQHLALWRDWVEDEESPFFRKADMGSIGLIGHSVGGESVVHAAAFNSLRYYPDDARVLFDFNFNIKALISLAPTDGHYRPADRLTSLRDIGYLVLHGSYDRDVPSFYGDRQYNRVKFSRPGNAFKASVYIHRANHAQFNPDWGRSALPFPYNALLNQKPLLLPQEQQKITKTLVSAFLETTLRGDERYRGLFRDHRLAGSWLPRTIYLTRYEDPSFRLLAGFEEDLDLTTPSVRGGALAGEGLAVWREQDIRLRDGEKRGGNAVVLGWNRGGSQGAGDPPPPCYTLTLPAELHREWRLRPSSLLVFQLARSHRIPPPLAAERNQDGSGESRPEKPGGRGGLETDPADEDFDLSVELVLAEGKIVSLALSRVRDLPPILKVEHAKSEKMNRELFYSLYEPAFQTFEIPLSSFADQGGAVDLASLRAIRFCFDRTSRGTVFLDDIGFASP